MTEDSKSDLMINYRLQVLGALLSRAQLLSRLGSQFQGDRNIYSALGYKELLTYDDFAVRYTRQDIAKAIINRPVEATWRGDFSILESEDKNDTALEKEYKLLHERLSLKFKFIRLDKLSSLGRYGILLLGFSDTQSQDDMANPVQGSKLDLNYVKPLSESSATIASYDINSKSVRFGLPETYNITLKMPDSGGSSVPIKSMLVHYSRVIHVTGELMESEVEGVPNLQVVYNRLMDIEKLVGSSAEMFWRGARPGYHGKVKEDYQLTDTMRSDLITQLDEFEHNLRRILINEGVDFEPFAMQIADPDKHLDIQIQMISAVTGIPKRILVGSERGELSSSQDKDSWLSMIQSRREDYAEGQIIRPFIDRCVAFGVLSAAKDSYSIKWPNLFALSEKENADIGKVRAEATAAYGNSPEAQIVLPPSSFLRHCLGLEQEEIDLIEMEHQTALREEEESIAEERRLAEEERNRQREAEEIARQQSQNNNPINNPPPLPPNNRNPNERNQ